MSMYICDVCDNLMDKLLDPCSDPLDQNQMVCPDCTDEIEGEAEARAELYNAMAEEERAFAEATHGEGQFDTYQERDS
tara:strand:- start:127 stop:360 length:234 start_codon:yes stop_codon:yes gene_type:complete